ncbi:MAG TPA: VOC family protein [Gemmatimonadales bacterium]|nr:VOC family protein [Gemmatimonadales bacterium]
MADTLTFLTYERQAEEAAQLYCAVVPGSRITEVLRYGDGGPVPAGTVMTVAFELAGRPFVALNAGQSFGFANGISIAVMCDTQAELDHVWDGLLEGGGQALACGWLTDRFGVAWQVTPKMLPQLLADPDHAKAQRAFTAMCGMTKLDVEAIRVAAAGES